MARSLVTKHGQRAMQPRFVPGIGFRTTIPAMHGDPSALCVIAITTNLRLFATIIAFLATEHCRCGAFFSQLLLFCWSRIYPCLTLSIDHPGMAPVNAFTDVFASTSGRCAETAWGRSTQFTSSYQRRSFVRFPPFLATRSSQKSCYSIRVQEASSSRSSSSSSSNGKHDITSAEVPDFLLSSTRFVAETLLPTEQGKFRLRGYRHTVRGCSFTNLWPAGGVDHRLDTVSKQQT